MPEGSTAAPASTNEAAPDAVSPPPTVRPWWAVWLRVLLLRFDGDDIAALGRVHLVLGVLVVWGVGVGRYWDSPRAEPLQKLGVGSLIYVPVLAVLLWVIVAALKPERGGFMKLLTFLTLTAPPAVIYAIPIEWWVPLDTAQGLNAAALGLVAVWRVAMYGRYLYVWNRLPAEALVVSLLLPITGIILALAMLNLEHVVFQIMGGLSNHEPTSADDRYAIVMLLAMFSFLAAPFLFIFWLVHIGLRRRRR